MSLRKKFVNSTLINKTCTKCKNTYPRTEDYFYRKEHATLKNVFNYFPSCITCDNKRTNEYKSKNKEKISVANLKYFQSEKGYFKALYSSIKKSKKGNLFRDFDEFMDCWHIQQGEHGEYCPYYPHIKMTKIKGKGRKSRTITNISVDRLVNTLPYSKDNIMFVSWKANDEKGNVSPYLAKKILEFINEKKMLKLFIEIDTCNRTNKPFIPPYKR
jgi:hypothetical protein